MAEASAGEVVVAYLAHERGAHGYPFARSFGAPSTRAAGRTPREPGAPLQRLDDLRQLPALGRGETGSKSDVIQLALIAIETEQQRPDLVRLRARVPEAGHHAIGGAEPLDLLHRVAIAGVIRLVRPFGDHSIAAECRVLAHPAFRLRDIRRRWRQLHDAAGIGLLHEGVQAHATLVERKTREVAASIVDEEIEHDEPGRRLSSELPDTALGRVDAHQQI